MVQSYQSSLLSIPLFPLSYCTSNLGHCIKQYGIRMSIFYLLLSKHLLSKCLARLKTQLLVIVNRWSVSGWRVIKCGNKTDLLQCIEHIFLKHLVFVTVQGLSHQATNFLNHSSTPMRLICIGNGVVLLKLVCRVVILYVGLI